MKVLITVMIVLGMLGCGKGDGDSSSASSLQFASELLGTWETGCVSKISRDIEIKKTTLSLSTLAASDNECAASDAETVFSTELISESDGKYTVITKTATITLHSQEAVASFNDKKLYGYDDWEFGKAKSILDRKYNDTASKEQFKSGAEVVFEFAVEGDGRRLKFTDFDGSTSELTLTKYE